MTSTSTDNLNRCSDDRVDKKVLTDSTKFLNNFSSTRNDQALHATDTKNTQNDATENQDTPSNMETKGVMKKVLRKVCYLQ